MTALGTAGKPTGPLTASSADEPGSDAKDRGSDMPLLGTWHSADRTAPVPLPKCHDRFYAQARVRILATALAAPPGQAVSYARRKAWYADNKRYAGSGLTYTYVTRAIDELNALGWIESNIAKSWPEGRGTQSTFWASDRLREQSGNTPLEYRPDEVIALHGADRKLADYKDTDFTHKERWAMRGWNEAVAASSITLDAPDVVWTGRPLWIDNCFIDPRRVRQHRVYNGDFQHGGRAYGGWWLELTHSKDERYRRRQIRIGGEPTVELDFSACQPALLYAELGRVPDDDPYRVASVVRPTVKEAMLRMINAASKGEAEGSLAAWLAGLGDAVGGHDPTASAERKTLVGARLPEARRIIAAVADRHPHIARQFCKPKLGVRLQWLEAQVMATVAKRCLKSGIVPLCVHDSMRVPVSSQDQVAEFMRAAWFDRFGVEPVVKPD